LSFEAWALFCLTETLLSLKPGPAVLLVVGVAMTRGRAHGIAASLGVLSANACYFALSATGLAALLNLSSRVYLAIRWTGAVYLIWLGARMLLRSRPAQPEDAPAPSVAHGRSYWQGFATQAANPSLLVYFTAILPQFVDPKGPLAGQVAILAASSIVIELIILASYSALSQRAGGLVGPGSQPLLERCAGVLLIAAGAGLAAVGRD
jgi:homoserine/homoserine lactone efflux protein